MHPKPQDIATRIKAKAKELGFPLAGITTPSPPEHFYLYKQWIEQGYHASMNWMASEKALQRRNHPEQVLPGCRSILVLGMPYLPNKPSLQNQKNRGRIASYAWGDDYHNVIPPLLGQLVTYINTLLGTSVSARWYTDTGPVLERELGQRAGLGWIGKNSCLINPHIGSYFFIAEIFLDIALPPDNPFKSDHCGSCHRCIDACPTNCILPNRTIDSSRCISYLTIEHREAIPKTQRKALNDWLFGCDICQQVCPWNERFATTSVHPAFEARGEIIQLDLSDVLQLSAAAFSTCFKGSAIKRTKRRGLLRNAAIVAGNTKSAKAFPALIIALTDVEPLVREHAAWALGEFGSTEAKHHLLAAAPNEQHPDVRRAIHQALEKIEE